MNKSVALGKASLKHFRWEKWWMKGNKRGWDTIQFFCSSGPRSYAKGKTSAPPHHRHLLGPEHLPCLSQSISFFHFLCIGGESHQPPLTGSQGPAPSSNFHVGPGPPGQTDASAIAFPLFQQESNTHLDSSRERCSKRSTYMFVSFVRCSSAHTILRAPTVSSSAS